MDDTIQGDAYSVGAKTKLVTELATPTPSMGKDPEKGKMVLPENPMNANNQEPKKKKRDDKKLKLHSNISSNNYKSSSIHSDVKNTGTTRMNPQQLRQRRRRILKDKIHQTKEHDQWQSISEKSDQRRGKFMTKFYMVIVTAIIVTIAAILNHTRPSFLFRRKRAPPALYMATLCPPTVMLDRDLPRFFRSFSIATPQNKHARDAVRHVVRSRKALTHNTGNLKVLLKAWDTTNVERLVGGTGGGGGGKSQPQENDSICGGSRFESAYRMGSPSRQADLVMWCLLTTRITEGFFLESVEMISNAFMINKRRGMVVVRSTGDSIIEDDSHHSDGNDIENSKKSINMISNAYYLHPRLPGESGEDTAPLPTMILSWLLTHPESSLQDPSIALQTQIHKFVTMEDHRDRYMYLHEICPDPSISSSISPPPPRSIAKQCVAISDNSINKSNHGIEEQEEDDEKQELRCCYFVVPESEGGTIRIRPDAANDFEVKT